MNVPIDSTDLPDGARDGAPRPNRATTAAAAASLAIGGLCMAGWAFDVDVLKTGLPGYVTIKANTSAGFLLSGLALAALGRGARPRWSAIPAAALIALGAATLWEYLAGVDLGIDQLAFLDLDTEREFGLPPGRMAVSTAFAFTQVGATILLLARPATAPWSQYPAFGVAAIAGFSLLSYAFGERGIFAHNAYLSLALPTAAGFAAVSAGLLAACPRRGPLGAIAGENPSAPLLRRLMFGTVALSLGLNDVALRASEAGLARPEFTLSLSACVNAVAVTVLIWTAAARARGADTRRDRVEAVLREAEARRRSLIESMPQLVWSTEPDGSCDYLSPQWVAYTGIPEPAHLGRSWLDAVHPEDRPAASAAWEGAVAGPRPYDVEYRLRGAGGTYRWFQARGVPVRDADGRLVKWYGTCTDVDDRRRFEDAMRRSEARFRALAETSSVGFVFGDARGRHHYANPTMLRLLGYSRGEFESGAVRLDLLTPPEFADRDARAAAELRDRGACTPYETSYLARDGRRVPVALGAARVDPEPGGEPLVAVTVVDLTQLKRAEDSLREADRRKDEFLAMLAHELRNPLGSISNAVAVFGRSSDPADLEWGRDVLARQVRHFGRLIDDLLDVSRINRGKIALKVEPTSADRVARHAVESARPAIEARGHALHVAIEPATIPMHADPTRLEQILVNLLHNAAKYTPDGGAIRLEVRSAGDCVEIAVSDTGIGLTAEALPRMFDLFAQGDRGLARSEGGLGIGLTLVRALSELHGGSVTATSGGPGLGSTFVVRLPARRDGVPVEPAPPPSAGARDPGAPLRILVVDDHVDAARGLSRLLSRLGHEVRTAFDGPAALEAAATFGPEAVILDIGLPLMDGYETARRLRGGPCGGPPVLIVALSGYGQDEDRRRSREAGFDHHLVKPVDHDALLALLGTAAGSST